jgi:hypothetical protein
VLLDAAVQPGQRVRVRLLPPGQGAAGAAGISRDMAGESPMAGFGR